MNERSLTLIPGLSLTARECVRFFRQKSRVIGAIGTPLLFWFLLGSGIGHSFQSAQLPTQMNYLEYLFPGTVALILLMTSVFSTISVIQDRKEGFLQAVLVAPVSNIGLVGGKVLGGAIIAVFQSLLLVLICPWVGFALTAQSIAMCLLLAVVFSVGLTAFAFIFAWKIDSVQGFHGIMNLILFPMWLLSGAIFPLQVAPSWIRGLMLINPLTYGVEGLRHALYSNQAPAALSSPSYGVCVLFLSAFSLIFVVLGTLVMRKRGDV